MSLSSRNRSIMNLTSINTELIWLRCRLNGRSSINISPQTLIEILNKLILILKVIRPLRLYRPLRYLIKAV